MLFMMHQFWWRKTSHEQKGQTSCYIWYSICLQHVSKSHVFKSSISCSFSVKYDFYFFKSFQNKTIAFYTTLQKIVYILNQIHHPGFSFSVSSASLSLSLSFGKVLVTECTRIRPACPDLLQHFMSTLSPYSNKSCDWTHSVGLQWSSSACSAS